MGSPIGQLRGCFVLGRSRTEAGRHSPAARIPVSASTPRSLRPRPAWPTSVSAAHLWHPAICRPQGLAQSLLVPDAPSKTKSCPASCSASVAASPRTRRSSSCAWRRAPGTRCASCRRPASRRFVGAASFQALTGAPVLLSEFERDPARGAFPGQPLPAHEPLSHLELVAQRRGVRDRAGLGQHDRQARARAWPTTC